MIIKCRYNECHNTFKLNRKKYFCSLDCHQREFESARRERKKTGVVRTYSIVEVEDKPIIEKPKRKRLVVEYQTPKLKNCGVCVHTFTSRFAHEIYCNTCWLKRKKQIAFDLKFNKPKLWLDDSHLNPQTVGAW